MKQKKESKREIKREKETIIVVDVEQESPVKTSSPPPSKRPRKTTNEAPKRKRTYRKSDSLLIVMDNEGIINDLADAESRPVKMTRSRSIGKETLKFEWGTGRVKILPDGAKRNRTKKSVESPKPEQQKSPVSTKAKGKSIEKDSDSDEPSESTWSLSEDKLLEQALWSKNPRSSNYWEQVASCVPERTAKECRHRYHSNFGREENSSCNRPQID